MSPIQPNNNNTPAITISTPPSSPTMATIGQTEEWDSVDDFSVDSLPVEESSSSSTAQSPFTPGSPPEVINEEEINESDVPKNSSAEILQKVGHWFYNTRLVQYMKSDERARVKHNYSTNSIWMLGVEYKFPEDGETVYLPKSDRGEHARGGRASSLLNYIMFGSSEEDEDYNDIPNINTHGRHHSDDIVHKLGKSHSFSQSPYENDFHQQLQLQQQQQQQQQQQHQQQQSGLLSPKVRSNSPPGGVGVIRRLRSLSLSRKPSPPPDHQESSKNENRISSGSLNTVHLKKIRPSTTQKDTIESQTNNSDQSRRLSILRKNSSSNNQDSLQVQDKKPRRKTFGAIFAGREKPKYSGSSPSSRLYPHLEIETDHDSKHFNDDPRLKRTSLDVNIPKRKNKYPSDDLCLGFSSEDESSISKHEGISIEILSGDNVSDETLMTRESINSSDYLGVKNNLLRDNEVSSDVPTQTDIWVSQKTAETGSVRSSGSVRSLPITPTSLYRTDSLGPLNPNQQKLLDFILDFQSRIFCCYRKDFHPIEPAFHTTDTGWGCMHRTGQSLLAQGFLWVLLGRDWRLHNPQADSDILIYRKILRWFADGPEPEQYYSIHGIARVGTLLDKKIGDWFGPATVAHALKRLSLAHKECPLAIYVPTDNTIYRSEVANVAIEHDVSDNLSDQKPWKPVLILISVRLGTDRLNPIYSSNLKALFTFPQFLGIAGGRPGRSLYFVAIQDDELLYLDPHFVRPAISLNKVTEFPIEDYHSTIVRTMDISEMDPSMLLGFLCQSSQDFDNLCDRIGSVMNSQFPLFTILSTCPIPGSWPRKKSLSDISLSDRSESDKSPSIIIETVDDVDDDVEDYKDIVTHEEEDDCVVSAKVDEEEMIFEEQEILDSDNNDDNNVSIANTCNNNEPNNNSIIIMD